MEDEFCDAHDRLDAEYVMQIFISIFEFGEFTRLTLKTFQVHTFPTQLRLFLIFFKYIYIYNIRLALITKTDLDYQGESL